MPPSDQGLLPADDGHDSGQPPHPGRADPRVAIDLRGGQGVAVGDYNTVNFTQILRGPGRVAGSAYLEHVRDIAPDILRDRDDELAALTRACSTPDLYDWWRADPWVGKSALMATFVLNPPPGVDIVSFFVTERFAGQADSGVFTETLLEQLAWMTGEDLPASPILEVRAAHRAQLIRLAAERSYAQGRRLVLVVDGLDEDTSRRVGLNLPSITSLLPARPSPGLKVLVASRPSPEIPDDVPDDHAIRHCRIHNLTPSPYALDIARLAKEEIRCLLEDPRQREILGLIAVSGGLTIPDLQALMHTSPFEIAQHLDGPMGRTVHRRNLDAADDGISPYVMAHDTLRVQTVSTLGEAILGEYRDRIHQWADGYRAQGWPQDTPAFLIEGYAEMLQRTPSPAQLASLSVDRARHDLIRARTGSDVIGLHEVSISQSLLLSQNRPDLGAMLRLAAHRDYLNARNARIPPDLPVAWVRLGDSDRALGLASMIENDDLHTRAMTALSLAFDDVDEADNAIQSARAIRQPSERVSALVDLAERVFSRPDGDRNVRLAEEAMNLAVLLPDPDDQASALTNLVYAVLQAGEFDQALRCAQAIASPPKRASARLKVAEALIPHDAARALTLVGETQAACDLFEDPEDRARTLSEVASTLRRAGQRDEAQRAANQAADTALHVRLGPDREMILDRVARELAALGDYRQALAVSDQASGPLFRADRRRRDVLRASMESLCQEGRPSEAVALVGELTDHGKRLDADLVLAGFLKTAGRDDLAVEAIRDAEDRLAHIEQVGDRLPAVTALIQAAVQTHLDIEAEPYLHQFLEAVAQVQAPASRNAQLRRVGAILLQAGELEWARRVFGNLDSKAEEELDSLLELLPRLLQAGSIGEAALAMTQCLALADKCPTPAAAAEARIRILATAGDRCDPSLTAAMVSNIQSLVLHVRDLEARARLLTSAIVPLARLLPQADVLRMVRDVEATADGIPQQDPRASVLAGLANTLLDAEMNGRARQAAMSAEAAAQVDPSADIRIGDLEDLVDTLCRMGDTQRAQVVAEQLPEPQARQRLLSKVTARHAAVNPADEELGARRNQDPYLQSVGLLDAAQAYVRGDRPRDAQRLCADVERQSRNVKTPYYRLGLWINLADVFLSLSDTDNAQRLIDEVVTRLPEVSRAPSRALVMATLTGLLARMGRQADAGEWSHRSEELSLSLTRPSTQAHALCGLAISVAPFDPGRGRRLLAQSLAVGPWPTPLAGLADLDPDALREVVDSGFQFVPPLHTSGEAGHEP